MTSNTRYTIRVALIVALGGFLMGFDASVISDVVSFIGPEFELTNIQVGWAVASLTLTSTLAMMTAGLTGCTSRVVSAKANTIGQVGGSCWQE